MQSKVINRFLVFILLTCSLRSQDNVEDIINLSKNEIQISRSDYAETDYRVCNRNNNLILTALQHRFSFNDNFVNSVVYASNDNGINWKRSFLIDDLKENQRIINAQSPVVLYHQDIAYHAFITKKYLSNTNNRDSISQSIQFNISRDDGTNWELDVNNQIKEIMPVDNRPGEGLLFEKSNLDLFNYQNSIYCSFLEKEIFKNNIYSLCFKNLIGTNEDLIKLRIPDEFLFISDISYLVVNDIIKLVFVGLTDNLGIFMMDIDLNNNEILSYQKITNIFFKGSYNIPGSLIDEVPSVNPQYLGPKPKLEIIGDNYYCIYSASGINEQEFDLDIYLSKSFDNGKTWMSPRIVNSLRDGSQFYPSINIVQDTVVCSWVDTKDGDNSSSSIKIAYSFNETNTFDNEFEINSARINSELIGQRNFDYKLGSNNYSYIFNNNIFSFWPDTRTKDGNVEIYMSSYPIRGDIDRFLYNDEYQLNFPYPNPSVDNLNISIDIFTNSNISCNIYNYNGQLVKHIFDRHFQPGNYVYNCETSNMPEGTYLINLVTDKNNSTKKFVIKK